MGRLAAITIILASATATIVLAAGRPGSAPSARPRQSSAPAARALGAPTASAPPAGGEIRSRAARITAGRRITVLALPRIGRFVVACDRAARSTATFVPDHLLPTSDVVVTSPRGTSAGTLQPSRPRTAWRSPAATLAETWQIAPFAAAHVRVVTAHVASRAAHGSCAASVLAVVGPDQGNTVTASAPSGGSRTSELTAE